MGRSKIEDANEENNASKAIYLCRFVLVFPAPPTPEVLALANRMGRIAWDKGIDVHAIWAWTKQNDFSSRTMGVVPVYQPRFLPNALLAGPEGKAPLIAISGHIEIANEEDVKRSLERILEPLRDLPEKPTLLTGYAEGADQTAIKIWRKDRKAPLSYLFPYPDPSVEKDASLTHAWTDVPSDDETRRICFTDEDIAPNDVAIMNPIGDISGHVLVAEHIANKADWLIAIWDGVPPEPSKLGGTAHVVELMRMKGKRVDVIKGVRG